MAHPGDDRYRDLGGGIYDDGLPDPPASHVVRHAGVPACPICGLHDADQLTGRADGWFCRTCGFVYSGEADEYTDPKNTKRRELAAEARRPRPNDAQEVD